MDFYLITMQKFCTLTLLFLSTLFVLPTYTHLCHDPFRPTEHLVLVPDREIVKIEKSGEFRIYIENTFSCVLEKVKLLVESSAFDIEVKPQVLEKLSPGERSFFVVRLKLKQGIKPGNYPLEINVEAKSAELKPSIRKIDVSIQEVEKIDQDKEEVKPLLTPPQQEILPQKTEPELPQPKEILQNKIYPQLKKQENLEVDKTTVPSAKEITQVLVKVEKIPFYQKPYFYVVLILVLLIILIWRKLK